MMKRLVLFVFLIGNTLILSAQIINTVPPTSGAGTNNNIIKSPNAKDIPGKTSDKQAKHLAANTIADNVANDKSFSKFFKAMKVAGLTETFKSKGPVTVFIPDDQAFEKMASGKLDTLLKPAHLPELIAFVSNHAISGKFNNRLLIKQIHSKKQHGIFTTLGGSKLTGTIDDAHNVILTDETGGKSVIKQADVAQSNGMAFIIDGVLIPKNKLL